MRLLNAFFIAFSTYSRIPMPDVEWTDANRRYSMCFFPLIGAVIGALLLAWLWLSRVLGIGGLLQGSVGALIPLAVSGGIHMDGFLDTADALASWQSKEKRLEILKDTHVGAFAVIGGSMYLMLLAGAYSEAARADAVILALGFVLSRALSALALALFKNARENGMLNGFKKSADTRRVAYVMSAVIALCAITALCLDIKRGAAGIAACAISFALYRRRAYKLFGGVTGDLAGHFLQSCELLYAISVVLIGKAL